MKNIVSLRARAFAGEGIKRHNVQVDPDGTVRVYDSTAGHYTLCHSLTENAKRRARKLCRDSVK